MGGNDTLTFFHAPNTRSTGVRVLLEELGAPYRLHPLNMKAGEQRQPAYLAVNPMGKVPAILHRGALVAEQSAVYQYLGDLFPKAGFGACDRRSAARAVSALVRLLRFLLRAGRRRSSIET